MPESWYAGSPTIDIDGDEIQVVGALAPPELPDGTPEDEVRVAEQARIAGFREETRGARMRIADEAQPAFRRAVSWGAECGGTGILFTTAGVPVMTRLRMDDRQALDTLIDAGVARSRSEALAWCVRLVDQHEAEWIRELRDAMSAVEEVRNRGPKIARATSERAGVPACPYGTCTLTIRSRTTSASPTTRCARPSLTSWPATARSTTRPSTEGALPANTKELIALAISITRECDGCIAAHGRNAGPARRARRGGRRDDRRRHHHERRPRPRVGPRALAAFDEFAQSSPEYLRPGPDARRPAPAFSRPRRA